MLLQDVTTKVGSRFVLHYHKTSIGIARYFKMLGVAPFEISLSAAKDKSALFECFRVAMRMPSIRLQIGTH